MSNRARKMAIRPIYDRRREAELRMASRDDRNQVHERSGSIASARTVKASGALIQNLRVISRSSELSRSEAPRAARGPSRKSDSSPGRGVRSPDASGRYIPRSQARGAEWGGALAAGADGARIREHFRLVGEFIETSLAAEIEGPTLGGGSSWRCNVDFHAADGICGAFASLLKVSGVRICHLRTSIV